MARRASPWYRKSCDTWCVYQNGKLISLVKGKANKREAYRRFLEMPAKANHVKSGGRITGKEVCNLFLKHAKAAFKPNTHAGYKRFLDSFGEAVGAMDGNDVKPKEVTAWLDEQLFERKKIEGKDKVIIVELPWGKTTRFNAITAIKRAWAWAKEEGHLSLNQLAPMRRPRPQTRAEIPDESTIRTILKSANPEFRDVLDFIHETGCRPGEVAMMSGRHVKLANREVRYNIGEDKTSEKTGKPRVIHLNDAALEILVRLVRLHPAGPLFRNSKGNAWTRHAMACAIAKIRLRKGLDSTAVVYALRHHWATDALAKGVPLSVVAEMMGNSPEIVAKVYSHLSDHKKLLMEAANKVRPANGDQGALAERQAS